MTMMLTSRIKTMRVYLPMNYNSTEMGDGDNKQQVDLTTSKGHLRIRCIEDPCPIYPDEA